MAQAREDLRRIGNDGGYFAPWSIHARIRPTSAAVSGAIFALLFFGGIQADTVSAVEAMNEALPQVQDGVQLAGSASDSLRRIRAGADRTLARVREVADATTEQSAASTAIAQRIEQIAQMVEETTSTIRGTAEMARQVRATAGELKAQIARFRV